MENKDEIREDLLIKKSLPLLDVEELKYVQKPVGKALYLNSKIKKETWKNKIKCNVCGKHYTRSNLTHHRNTEIHKAFDNINKKMMEIFINKL